MRAGRLGCLVAAWPVAELVVLLVAASTWGWEPVVLALLIGFIVGVIIMRVAITAVGRSWRDAFGALHNRQVVVDPDTGTVLAIESSSTRSESTGAPPAQTILLIPAGLAIALPGFIGDVVGLVLLVPGVRRRIARSWARRLRSDGP